MTAPDLTQQQWDALYALLVTEDPADYANAVTNYGADVVTQTLAHPVIRAAISYRRSTGQNEV